MEQLEDNTVPFNMALFFYNELHIIRKNKVLCLMNDNIEEYYWCLQQMFVYLSFKITPPEYKEIDIELDKSFRKIQTIYNIPDKYKKGKIFELKKELRDLDILLNKYMFKYGFLFPKIKAPAGFDGIMKQYGLK